MWLTTHSDIAHFHAHAHWGITLVVDSLVRQRRLHVRNSLFYQPHCGDSQILYERGIWTCPFSCEGRLRPPHDAVLHLTLFLSLLSFSFPLPLSLWHADVPGQDDWMMQSGDDASEGTESESGPDSEPDYDMDKVCYNSIEKG